MSVGVHVKYRYSCQILIKSEFSRQVFDKSSNIRFYKNPSGWRRVVARRRTDRQTQRS